LGVRRLAAAFPRFVEAGLQPGSFLATRHSSLAVYAAFGVRQPCCRFLSAEARFGSPSALCRGRAEFIPALSSSFSRHSFTPSFEGPLATAL
jgi:hypothetical protein